MIYRGIILVAVQHNKRNMSDNLQAWTYKLFLSFHRGEAKIFFHAYTYICFKAIQIFDERDSLIVFTLPNIDHCLFRLNAIFPKIIQR